MYPHHIYRLTNNKLNLSRFSEVLFSDFVRDSQSFDSIISGNDKALVNVAVTLNGVLTAEFLTSLYVSASICINSLEQLSSFHSCVFKFCTKKFLQCIKNDSK